MMRKKAQSQTSDENIRRNEETTPSVFKPSKTDILLIK